jgi:hypothetical protein
MKNEELPWSNSVYRLVRCMTGSSSILAISLVDDESYWRWSNQSYELDLHAAIRWVPSFVVYDNDLEYVWSWYQKNDGNTGDTRTFRQIQTSRWIITLHHVFLYCSWQLMWWLLFFWGCPALLLYQGGRAYKDSSWVSYNCSPTRTLSLVFFNYKIWSYSTRILFLGDILLLYCCNMGLCQPHMGLLSYLGHVPRIRILDNIHPLDFMMKHPAMLQPWKKLMHITHDLPMLALQTEFVTRWYI